MRRSAHTASSGPSVFPTAIASASGRGAPTARFTATAPSATPGQHAYPQRSKAATAIPVGSQISVMLVPNAGSISPSRPVMKYARARISEVMMGFNRGSIATVP